MYNFGPTSDFTLTVGEITDRFIDAWGEGSWRDGSIGGANSQTEALTLGLNPTKAMTELNWRPQWQINQAIDCTARWYREQASGTNARVLCERQIAAWTG